MSFLTQLKAAGCRVDGLLINQDRSLTFVDTVASGPWTQPQKDSVNSALGLTAQNATAQANLLAKVDKIRDARLTAGYADATTGKTFQCDNVSVSRWTALTTLAYISVSQAKGQQFQLIAADNTTVTLSDADTFALFSQRVSPWVQATVFYARTLKDEVLAGTQPADLTAGWP